jgi:pimeloyl-ACP methyl ester carboxylesterase
MLQKKPTAAPLAQLLTLLSVALIGCTRITETPIDVTANGHRMHLLVVSDGRQKPTVVLESGMGGGVAWNSTRGEIAKFAQVVTYDRAGAGQSEAGPTPRDARAVAADLHAALHAAKIEPPYVLAGESLGGLYVQVFAAMYPDETVGLVLVDPTHADPALSLSMDEVKAWYLAHAPNEWPRVEDVLVHKSPRSLQSFLACKYKLMDEFIETMPEPRRSEMRREWWAMIDTILKDKPLPVLNPGENEEATAMVDSMRQAIAARPPPNVPTILLAAGKIDLDALPADAVTPNVLALQTEARRWKMAAFQRWIDATPGGKLIVVPDSGHGIESEKPQVVIDAVRDVLRHHE